MKKETQKVAILHIGKDRATLTKKQLHEAIDRAFEEKKQNNFLYGFSIQELTKDELKSEKEFDTLKTK